MPSMLSIPEDVIIDLLKELPENELIEIFHKVLVKADTEKLSAQERKIVYSAKEEYENGECINWDDIR